MEKTMPYQRRTRGQFNPEVLMKKSLCSIWFALAFFAQLEWAGAQGMTTVVVNGELLEGVKRVVLGASGKVQIVYGTSGVSVEPAKLPQHFLQSWGITEEQLNARAGPRQETKSVLQRTDVQQISVTDYPKPKWYKVNNSIHCDNGILRIRPMENGITWFDVYHPQEKKWYVNKNNLNLLVHIPNFGWKNTELDRVPASVTVIKESQDELMLKCHFDFPHGAKFFTYVTLKRGSPSVRFEVHNVSTSVKITGFQWHITDGQSEAVKRLAFDGHTIEADKLPKPFPGRRLAVQHVEWFKNIRDLNFYFGGDETTAPDPKNPKWMGRVLGLKQHAIWGTPMRSVDAFAFEARDQPWQPDWGIPDARPWIEGLWFVRNGGVLEGDSLTFQIDNLVDLRRDRRH